MDSFKRVEAAKKHLADVYIDDRERIGKLRRIMERDLGRPVDYDEAREFATDLVNFYKILAQGRRVILTPGKGTNE